MNENILGALTDKQAITEVLHRYCRGIDRGDAELVNSVYHEDATDDHGIWKGPGISFAAWMLPQLALIPCMHAVTNILIDLRGDIAFSEAYCLAFSAGSAINQENSEGNNTVMCRFVDRFERRNGEWKIADRKVLFDVTRRHKPELESGIQGPGLTWGRKDHDDLSYRRTKDT